MRGRGALQAVAWTVIEHPDEKDRALLKRAADASPYISGQGVSENVIADAQKHAHWLLLELDRRGYLTNTAKIKLSALMG